MLVTMPFARNQICEKPTDPADLRNNNITETQWLHKITTRD